MMNGTPKPLIIAALAGTVSIVLLMLVTSGRDQSVSEAIDRDMIGFCRTILCNEDIHDTSEKIGPMPAHTLDEVLACLAHRDEVECP